MDSSPTLAAYLLSLRERVRITARRAAADAGLSRCFVYMVEQGTRAPGPESLDRLLTAYGASPAERARANELLAASPATAL